MAGRSFFLLRDRNNRFHRSALGIALTVACISIPLQILSGHQSARAVSRLQPAKLAAMEANYRTQTGAPLLIGGIPNDELRTTDYAFRIPGGLSFLLTGTADAKVVGLEEFHRSDWPNVRIVHWSFDFMVGSGMAMLALGAWSVWLWCKRRRRRPPVAARALVAPGRWVVAIEAGWVVTEAGPALVITGDATETPSRRCLGLWCVLRLHWIILFLAFIVFFPAAPSVFRDTRAGIKPSLV